jgi:hypothetical protein
MRSFQHALKTTREARAWVLESIPRLIVAQQGIEPVLKPALIRIVRPIEVQMNHRPYLPGIGLSMLQLLDVKTDEEVMPTFEVRMQSRYEQALSKSSWTTQEIWP